jgi:hypothetical protein
LLKKKKKKKGEEWLNVSYEVKDLIKKMLEKNPEKRISANEAF